MSSAAPDQPVAQPAAPAAAAQPNQPPVAVPVGAVPAEYANGMPFNIEPAQLLKILRSLPGAFTQVCIVSLVCDVF